MQIESMIEITPTKKGGDKNFELGLREIYK